MQRNIAMGCQRGLSDDADGHCLICKINYYNIIRLKTCFMIKLDDQNKYARYRKQCMQDLPDIAKNEGHKGCAFDEWLFRNIIVDQADSEEFHRKFWIFFNTRIDAFDNVYYDAWQHIIYNRCEDVVRSIDPNPEVCTQQSFPYVYYITHNLNTKVILDEHVGIMPKSDLSLNTFDKPIYVMSSDASINESILCNKELLQKFDLVSLSEHATSVDVLKIDIQSFQFSTGAKLQFFKDKTIEHCMFTLEPIPEYYIELHKRFMLDA